MNRKTPDTTTLIDYDFKIKTAVGVFENRSMEKTVRFADQYGESLAIPFAYFADQVVCNCKIGTSEELKTLIDAFIERYKEYYICLN